MLSRTLATCALCCSLLPAAAALAQGKGGVAGAGIEALTTVRVASGMNRPVYATHAPGDFTRLYIVEQFVGSSPSIGRIRVLNLKTGVLQPTADPFFTVTVETVGSPSNEQGLLGLAFDPAFQTNGLFYVNYTDPSGDTRVVQYGTLDKDHADLGSAKQLLFIDQPFSNHNGGWIDFGPDGMLYIATGDGGSACDPGQRSQDITGQLHGKILRVQTTIPATAPPDNPFVGIVGDDEIWHFGLRNPFRCSFDRLTGDLYMADVGQNAREEIDVQPANMIGSMPGDAGYQGGVNYGWDCREGTACSNAVSFQCNGTTNGCTCNTVVSQDPIFEYSHSGGNCSIQGGYVYRGCKIPTLDGTYFYADHCSNQIWSLFWNGVSVSNQTNRTAELAPGGGMSISGIASFGEDALGELYITETFGGEVYMIVPVTPTISDADIDCSGSVGINDLLELLAMWGPCDGCIGDFDGDGSVSITDLLFLLDEWS